MGDHYGFRVRAPLYDVIAEGSTDYEVLDAHYPNDPSDFGDFDSPPYCGLCGNEPMPCTALRELAVKYGIKLRSG